MSGMRALVVGVSGIGGNNVARSLLGRGFDVTGISRRPPRDLHGIRHVSLDLLDREAATASLGELDVEYVFVTSWTRRETEAENIAANGAMMRNLLDGLAGARLRHVCLVTGLKHYLGPFEAYGQFSPETPFRETQQRLEYPNFYYEQEDILFAAADRHGFGWSVHRPHTMIGWAIGNAMNMGVTLSVYGTICRETGRPFVFPGSPEQWDGVTDVTDARLLAHHMIWAASTPDAANEAFNVVNGGVFRWRQLWGQLAEALGVETAPYPGVPTPLEEQMHDAGPVWAEIVDRHGLLPYGVGELASWWHTDADLTRPLETFADMTKSRRLGFHEYQDSAGSFTDLFERLRAEKIIPA